METKKQQEYTITQQFCITRDKEHSKHEMHIKGIQQRRDEAYLNNAQNRQCAYIEKKRLAHKQNKGYDIKTKVS